MNLILVDRVLTYVNFGLEFTSIMFITFVFFNLVFSDKEVQLSNISEKLMKFKRYDILKSSLIFLVLALYFIFFSKVSGFLKFPTLSGSVFTLIANVFLLLFVFRLYQLLIRYVPKVKE